MRPLNCGNGLCIVARGVFPRRPPPSSRPSKRTRDISSVCHENIGKSPSPVPPLFFLARVRFPSFFPSEPPFAPRRAGENAHLRKEKPCVFFSFPARCIGERERKRCLEKAGFGFPSSPFSLSLFGGIATVEEKFCRKEGRGECTYTAHDSYSRTVSTNFTGKKKREIDLFPD